MPLYPDRGDGRKAHYGDGKQPLDTIRERGWENHFCAGNVVKYLRRTKDLEHSLESARFYYRRLCELAVMERDAPHGTKRECLGASDTLTTLLVELTFEERERLTT